MNTQTIEPAFRRPWDEYALVFETWKYYSSVGGADKDRMVKISTWLLGFSSLLFLACVKGELQNPLAARLLIIIGIIVSLTAALVALMYGGYATWNWAIADEIARRHAWPELLPANNPFSDKDGWSLAICLAKPRPRKLAPIFWLFIIVSIGSAVVHAILLYQINSLLPPLSPPFCPPPL